MTSKVIDRNGTTIKLEITIDIDGSTYFPQLALSQTL